MEDDLRRLERAYRSSGSAEDHARWLVALVRSGALDERRLRLAARVGHPGAVAATAVEPVALRPTFIRTWFREAVLDHAEPEVVVRALLAGARLALTEPLSTAERAYLVAVERWLGAPSDRERIVRAVQDVDFEEPDSPEGGRTQLAWLLALALEAPTTWRRCKPVLDGIHRSDEQVRDAMRDAIAAWTLGPAAR